MCGTIENVIDNDFDIILANINKNVLLEIKTELFEKASTGGLIIISGILESDHEEIKRQFTQIGLTALEFQQLDEWIGFIFKKA
jgi:ribosomal protein L11 methyltransferase